MHDITNWFRAFDCVGKGSLTIRELRKIVELVGIVVPVNELEKIAYKTSDSGWFTLDQTKLICSELLRDNPPVSPKELYKSLAEVRGNDPHLTLHGLVRVCRILGAKEDDISLLLDNVGRIEDMNLVELAARMTVKFPPPTIE
jgi:hypothetical protein